MDLLLTLTPDLLELQGIAKHSTYIFRRASKCPNEPHSTVTEPWLVHTFQLEKSQRFQLKRQPFNSDTVGCSRNHSVKSYRAANYLSSPDDLGPLSLPLLNTSQRLPVSLGWFQSDFSHALGSESFSRSACGPLTTDSGTSHLFQAHRINPSSQP